MKFLGNKNVLRKMLCVASLWFSLVNFVTSSLLFLLLSGFRAKPAIATYAIGRYYIAVFDTFFRKITEHFVLKHNTILIHI